MLLLASDWGDREEDPLALLATKKEKERKAGGTIFPL